MSILRNIFSAKAKQTKGVVDASEILRASPLLDPVWYRQTYADLSHTAIDVARHYIDHGAGEGRDPGPNFDTKFYLKQNPDVEVSGINPLLHYILHGADEGRLPNPYYEPSSSPQPAAVAERNLVPVPAARDTAGGTSKPAPMVSANTEHRSMRMVSQIASDEQDVISAYFDKDFYLHRYPDVAAARIDPLEHFCTHGWKEERDPTPWFSMSYYLNTNPDVRLAGINPFWHYLTSGRGEVRSLKPTFDARQELLKYLQVPIDLGDALNICDEEIVTEDSLIEKLRKKFEEADGVVLSFSHSCYPRVTAGTELFIADEQRLFNERRFVYLHFAPIEFSIFINNGPIEKTFTRMSLDGEVIGVAPFSAVVRVLKTVRITALRRRLLVMHSPLGQSTPAFLRVFAALEPTDTYYWVHDYSSLCTGYNLLRNNVAYCHAPSGNSVGCSVCIFESSRLENAKQLNQIFQAANFTVVAPSKAALNIWQKASELPHKAAIMQEHCRIDASAGLLRNRQVAEQIGRPGHPAKVAFVGFPVHHKGWPAFERLVEETWADSAYQFFHFSAQAGAVHSSRIRHIDAVVSTQRRDAMVELLCEHEIDIVTILAPWPETFSYVTFEALAAGCDIVTLADSGNVAAVVQQTGRGRVLANEDEVLEFFINHDALELVRSRAEQPNPRGSLQHCGTTAAIVFNKTH